MKRLKSKHAEKKKQRRNNTILALVLIMIMFGSVFGIIVNSFGEDKQINKVVYNGFEFIGQNGYWYLIGEDVQFSFKYNPEQIEAVESNVSAIANYVDKPLYISSEDVSARTEIYKNLKQVVQRMQMACYGNETCSGNLPVKTCEDNFIIIRESAERKITQEQNCVFIDGEEGNLTEVVDEFLFQTLGIR